MNGLDYRLLNEPTKLLQRLADAEAQLESIYDGFVDGNCTETYINIAPFIKAAIKGRNRERIL